MTLVDRIALMDAVDTAITQARRVMDNGAVHDAIVAEIQYRALAAAKPRLGRGD